MSFKVVISSVLTLLLAHSSLEAYAETTKVPPVSTLSSPPPVRILPIPMPTPYKSEKAVETWRVEYAFSQTQQKPGIPGGITSPSETTIGTNGVLFLTEGEVAAQQNIRSHTYLKESRPSDLAPFPLMGGPAEGSKPNTELVTGVVNEGFSIAFWRSGEKDVLNGRLQNVELLSMSTVSVGGQTVQLPQTLEQKEEFSMHIRHGNPFRVVFEGPVSKGILTVTVSRAWSLVK